MGTRENGDGPRFYEGGKAAPRKTWSVPYFLRYLDEAVTERVLAMGEQVVSQGAEIEVRRFAA